MNKAIKVFKFGGAALKDAAAVRNVAAILRRFPNERLLVVVSAMGKTTDALEGVVEAHQVQNGSATDLLNDIKRGHYQIMGELFPLGHEAFALVNDLFVPVEWVLDEPPHDNYDYMYDQIVSAGELVSSRIVVDFLRQEGFHAQWLDARDVILTDDIFREGWVLWSETQQRCRQMALPLLREPGLVITQGFIGSTAENLTTTLGRAGSDFSAAIFSHCLDAQSMTIWKDVPGMLTADPRFFPDALRLERLSYQEAIEMTYYGASVIHLKTIKPLQAKNIPLHVKSFIDPDDPGTRIEKLNGEAYPPMVAVERKQALLRIGARDYSFIAEQHMSELFKWVSELRLQVNLIQNSAIHFLLCVNDTNDKVDRFVKKAAAGYEVEVERGLELITIRHDEAGMLAKLRAGREILFEKRIPHTLQMVVRQARLPGR